MAEVVVFNQNNNIVRHIITVNEPYDEATVKSWYYDNYHKRDGDKFIYCATSKERREIIEKLEKKETKHESTEESKSSEDPER